MRNIILTLIFTLLCFSASFAENEGAIGNIKSFKGDVQIIRQGSEVKPMAGAKVFQGDLIKTGSASSAGIIFKDSTIYTLGASSEVFITKYIFQPSKAVYDFKLKMNKGSAVYASGRMGKLSPESVEINTPNATVGIRGTKFLIKVD